ncbi:citrate lyase subunit gamma [Ligilactobacillus salitolerans]|uniref:Citrate lyase acyl carrier protein n=1 Tax=Ligilactobacillus salitolerans TaxID=1808352 RepID=A0A401IUP9_9LACO|nr:citrate lyase acyl carrier protein [Ligilactobacillus salitolerans]GBG95254.1 citrate lyase subunit gamma [Ligilactobacillus salitolerans]
MEIKNTAIAGTLESSDIQIMLSQGNNGIEIELESEVKAKFGAQINAVITETLKQYEIENAKVKAVDKGALDCVIKARTITVAQRALGIADQPAWEVF